MKTTTCVVVVAIAVALSNMHLLLRTRDEHTDKDARHWNDYDDATTTLRNSSMFPLKIPPPTASGSAFQNLITEIKRKFLRSKLLHFKN